MDVSAVENFPVLILTNEGEGQNIKSKAGHRKIPIHSELIRLGFLDYVEAIKVTGAVSLWPSLRLRKEKPLSLSAKPDFHRFRHTVRPLTRRAGFSEFTMDKITGHESGGSVGTLVYDHWTLLETQQTVEALRYPA